MANSPVPDEAGPVSLRRLAHAFPRAIATVWLAAIVVLLARLLGDPGLEVSGQRQGLLPVDDRAPEDEPLLLLTLAEDTLDPNRENSDRLRAAAAAIAERLGPRRAPLGPPAAELTAWLDAHALYLLPVEAHDALKQRLDDAAMARAIDELQARLSSPIYGVSGEEPRRDPLRLQELAQAHAGRLTHLGNIEDMPAELTAAGDLLALDGQALLMKLRTDDEPDALHKEIDAVAQGHGVEATLVGPGPQRHREQVALRQRSSRLLSVGLAGLVLVLSLALRSIRPVLAIVAALLSALAGLLVFGPALDPLGAPMLVLLLGFGCEGAMHLSRISPRGWPAAAVLGTALLPLSLSPYPTWQQWSIQWLVGLAVIVLLLRVVVPAALILLRSIPSPARRGFRLRPLRPLAVLMTVAALAGGAWAVPRLPFAAIDEPGAETDAAKQVREDFFDPRLVVRARSHGDGDADTLERAAEHARRLATLVPVDAARVDSPGRLVLPPGELNSRKQSLVQMKLAERMEVLREQLTARGFRADAFGEFLRGAADLDELPTPRAALDGPLGAWIDGYLQDDGKTLVTRVHLHPDSGTAVPRLEGDDGDQLVLAGPAVAARRDRQGFADWLGIYVAGQLWLGALAVWLSTRRLAAALACGVASLAAQTGVLAIMVPMGASLGPTLLPALLLVGAAAMVAGARACRAVTHDERFYAKGVLMSGLCQAVAGLTLLATDDPQWNAVGAVVAVGAVLASGAGLFIAPGMMRIFGSQAPAPAPTDRAPESSAQPPEPPAEPGDEPPTPEDDA